MEGQNVERSEGYVHEAPGKKRALSELQLKAIYDIILLENMAPLCWYTMLLSEAEFKRVDCLMKFQSNTAFSGWSTGSTSTERNQTQFCIILGRRGCQKLKVKWG